MKTKLPRTGQDWQPRARSSMEDYISAITADLPPGATIAEIEAVMLAHYKAMMQEVFQALADSGEPFPPRDQRPEPRP